MLFRSNCPAGQFSAVTPGNAEISSAAALMEVATIAYGGAFGRRPRERFHTAPQFRVRLLIHLELVGAILADHSAAAMPGHNAPSVELSTQLGNSVPVHKKCRY